MSGYAYAGLAGLQLVGGYFASQNIKETAQINYDIAQMNAEFAELDAYDAEIEGYGEVAKYQSIIDKTLGEQQAILTASDVDVTYGSAAEIQKETRFVAELNQMEIQKQYEERALGYTRQARDYRFNAFLDLGQAQTRASSVMFQSVIGASQTGLKGAYRSGLFDEKPEGSYSNLRDSLTGY